MTYKEMLVSIFATEETRSGKSELRKKVASRCGKTVKTVDNYMVGAKPGYQSRMAIRMMHEEIELMKAK